MPRKSKQEVRQNRITKMVEEFSGVFGLKHWDVQLKFDGSWSWNPDGYNVMAQTQTRARYKSASIRFHERLVMEKMGDKLLLRVVVHELCHIMTASHHRLLEDMEENYIAALKKSYHQRWTMIDEATAMDFARGMTKS